MGINFYGMGWDGTEKYVPWTSLGISTSHAILDLVTSTYDNIRRRRRRRLKRYPL